MSVYIMVSTFSPAEERRILSLLMHVVIWTFTTAAAVTAVPGSILSLCEFRLHLTSMTFDQIVIAECNARNSAVDRTSYLCAQFSAAGRNFPVSCTQFVVEDGSPGRAGAVFALQVAAVPDRVSYAIHSGSMAADSAAMQSSSNAWSVAYLSDRRTLRQASPEPSAAARLRAAGYSVGTVAWSKHANPLTVGMHDDVATLGMCGYPVSISVRSPLSFEAVSECEGEGEGGSVELSVKVGVAEWAMCPVVGCADPWTTELRLTAAEMRTCMSMARLDFAFDGSGELADQRAQAVLYSDLASRYEVERMFRVCMYEYLSDDGFAGSSGLVDVAGEDVLAGLSVGAKLGCFDQGVESGRLGNLGHGAHGLVVVVEDAGTGQQVSDMEVVVFGCGGDVDMEGWRGVLEGSGVGAVRERKPVPDADGSSHRRIDQPAGRTEETMKSIIAPDGSSAVPSVVSFTTRAFAGWWSVRQDMLRSIPCPSGRLRFTVLVISSSGRGQALPVFEELAETLHQGLLELGHQSQRRFCHELTAGCGMSADIVDTQVILLGTMHISRYSAASPRADTDAALAVEQLRMIPDDTILYNFEFVDTHVMDFATAVTIESFYWVTPRFLRAHSLYRVWEYSYHNHQAWRHHGIESTLVPVGYMPWLTDTSVVEASESERDIDVLFFGHGKGLRLRILSRLRQAGIRVEWPVWADGQDLLDLMRRAKIVLVLRSFGHGTEFKMSRLMVLLANKVFVVTQQMGVPQDVEWLRGGVVEVPVTGDVSVDSMELLEAVRYWLASPGLRREVARRGFELYRARRQSGLLEEAVRGLVSEGNRHCVE